VGGRRTEEEWEIIGRNQGGESCLGRDRTWRGDLGNWDENLGVHGQHRGGAREKAYLRQGGKHTCHTYVGPVWGGKNGRRHEIFGRKAA